MLDERAPDPAAQHGRTETGGTLSRTVGKRPDRHALPDGCDAQCFEVLNECGSAAVAPLSMKYYFSGKGNTSKENIVSTTMTSKGQVTIPKPIRDALHLIPGCAIEFSVNAQGEVVLHAGKPQAAKKTVHDRFEAARGKADIKWRTDELMALLRGED